MSNLTNALAIVIGINVLLFLAQASVLELDSGSGTFYNCEGTILSEFDTGNCTSTNYVLDDNPTSLIPSGSSSVNPDTGNIFTDAFSGIKNWFLDITGVSYLIAIVSAPTNFLKVMGLPSAFAFAVGALWYGVTLFLIIAFMFGRDA